MNDHRIEIGDTVCVNFMTAQYTLSSKAKVLFVPCSSGDCWGFEDLETHTIHYVSEGCTVTKIQSAQK